MPFLKKRKVSLVHEITEKSKRNGFRRAVFSTNKPPKDKYVGEWVNDKKEGIGTEYRRYDNNLFNNKIILISHKHY